MNQLETVTVYTRPITNLTTTTSMVAKKIVYFISYAVWSPWHGILPQSGIIYTDGETSLSKQNFA